MHWASIFIVHLNFLYMDISWTSWISRFLTCCSGRYDNEKLKTLLGLKLEVKLKGLPFLFSHHCCCFLRLHWLLLLVFLLFIFLPISSLLLSSSFLRTPSSPQHQVLLMQSSLTSNFGFSALASQGLGWRARAWPLWTFSCRVVWLEHGSLLPSSTELGWAALCCEDSGSAIWAASVSLGSVLYHQAEYRYTLEVIGA